MFLASWLIAPVAAEAATYYVAPDGNDANPGTSGQPWQALQHAAEVVEAGDTVRVRAGNYRGFYVDRSGVAGAPISFIADPGVAITADNPFTPDGINVEGAAHVVIDGFTADGRTRAGIRAALSEFVTIRNCRAGHNGRWGILTGFVDDVLIEDNEMHHSIAEHGIYVSNSGDRPIIRRNVVHDNRANGIHMNGDVSLGGDGVISGALVERNVIYGNGAGGGSGINMDGVSEGVVRNNLIFDHHSSGISLYRIDGGTGSRNNLVVNNTIVVAADGRWAVNISNGSTGNRLFNNILFTYHSWRGVISIDASSRIGFVSDYNSLMDRFSIDGGNSRIGLASWQGLGYDGHSILAAPEDHFVASGSDFRLRLDSPAIDGGTAVGAPPFDLDGVIRPQGAAVDIGAYERPTASTATPVPTATPLPGSHTISGRVRFHANGAAVAGVEVSFVGAGNAAVSTDADGNYSSPPLAAGSWLVMPTKIGGTQNGVSSLDAAYVLQAMVGGRAFDERQAIACDVTGDGTLSALDAARILRVSIGLSERFSAAERCGSDWLFFGIEADGVVVPPALDGEECQTGAVIFDPLSADISAQDFLAVPFGDCTGNWTP
jgi:hypothetical protein